MMSSSVRTVVLWIAAKILSFLVASCFCSFSLFAFDCSARTLRIRPASSSSRSSSVRASLRASFSRFFISAFLFASSLVSCALRAFESFFICKRAFPAGSSMRFVSDFDPVNHSMVQPAAEQPESAATDDDEFAKSVSPAQLNLLTKLFEGN